MAEVPEEELARIAYNAYASALQWRDFQGWLPRWEAARDDLHMAWSAVVQVLKLELEKQGAVRGVEERARAEATRRA